MTTLNEDQGQTPRYDYPGYHNPGDMDGIAQRIPGPKAPVQLYIGMNVGGVSYIGQRGPSRKARCHELSCQYDTMRFDAQRRPSQRARCDTV